MRDVRELLHYNVIRGQAAYSRSIDLAIRGQPEMFESVLREVESQAPTAAMFLVAASKYARYGFPLYGIGPRLQRLLAETRCDDVPREALRLPRPCVYVVLPDCPARLWGGERTRMHRVSGVYLQEYGDGSIQVLMWAGRNEKSENSADDASFWINLGIPEAPTVPGAPDHLNMEAYLDETLFDPRHDRSDAGMSLDNASPQEQQEQQESVRQVIRICTNLIIYLNSENAELVPLKQKGPAVTWVGPTLERQEQAADPRTWVYRPGRFDVTAPKAPEKMLDGKVRTLGVLSWCPPTRQG